VLVESGEPLPLACEPFGGLPGRHRRNPPRFFFFVATKTTRTAYGARTSDPGSVVRGQGVWLNLSRTPKFSPESPECPQIWGKLRKIVWKYSNCPLPTQPRASVSSVLDVSENGER
jgi:hypothetical protein